MGVTVRRSDSIADLGPGRYDGEPACLTYRYQEANLRWDDGRSLWIGEPEPSIHIRGEWQIVKLPTTAYPDWAYLSQPMGNPGEIGQSSYTWMPTSVLDADAGYDAGMTMEENLTAVLWNFEPDRVIRLGVVHYPMDNADVISTIISASADDYVGIYLDSGNGVRKWQTTGWQASTIDPPAKPVLAPHLYMAWIAPPPADVNGRLEWVLARWRWVGDPA